MLDRLGGSTGLLRSYAKHNCDRFEHWLGRGKVELRVQIWRSHSQTWALFEDALTTKGKDDNNEVYMMIMSVGIAE